MTTQKLLLEYALFAEVVVTASILFVMARKSLTGKFYALTAFLAVMTISNIISVATLFFRQQIGISKMLDYEIYSGSNWICAAIEYVLVLFIIYGIFRQAMRPMEGLHRAGKIIFRWVAGVSFALVFGLSFGPHGVGESFINTLTGQIQQGVSILTLCLLIFVCLATRYLGLTFRSHIFGVSLGLGIWATVSLVETAWYSSIGTHSLYSPVYLFSSLGSLAAFATWGTYFAMPEPERKMILLPTTSPYFLWNRISESLGDEPGFVAIAGFTPDMLAPAEMSMLTAQSVRAQERSALEQEQMDAMLGDSSSAYQSIAMQS